MLRLLRPPRRLCAHPTHPLRVPRPPPPLPSGGAQLRAFASYQRRPVVREPGAEGGSGSARRGLGGWLKAGAKAIVLLGGFLFWGTLTLEWLLVWLSPEEAEAMLREEEREEQATAAFFGLRSMLRDPDVLDDEYFSALAERKRLLCAYPTPSAPRAHGQRAVTDGWRRVRSGRICARSSGTTRRSSRSSARGAGCGPWCAAALRGVCSTDRLTSDVQQLIRGEEDGDEMGGPGVTQRQRERGETPPWCPRFHIQGEDAGAMAVGTARFVDNGRTGELTPVALRVEVVTDTAVVLDVQGQPPHGITYMRLDEDGSEL